MRTLLIDNFSVIDWISSEDNVGVITGKAK